MTENEYKLHLKKIFYDLESTCNVEKIVVDNHLYPSPLVMTIYSPKEVL